MFCRILIRVLMASQTLILQIHTPAFIKKPWLGKYFLCSAETTENISYTRPKLGRLDV